MSAGAAVLPRAGPRSYNAAMSPRVAAVLLLLTACPKGQETTPPEARPGDTFIVTRDTPFYDSGCAQSRPNDGKLKKRTKFTLVGAAGSCWNVKLEDEDETYIQADSVEPAK